MIRFSLVKAKELSCLSSRLSNLLLHLSHKDNHKQLKEWSRELSKNLNHLLRFWPLILLKFLMPKLWLPNSEEDLESLVNAFFLLDSLESLCVFMEWSLLDAMSSGWSNIICKANTTLDQYLMRVQWQEMSSTLSTIIESFHSLDFSCLSPFALLDAKLLWQLEKPTLTLPTLCSKRTFSDLLSSWSHLWSFIISWEILAKYLRNTW